MSTRPEAEAWLDRLLSTMQPALDPEDYVYAVISAASRGLSVPFCRVREAEGDTVILSRAQAERNGLDCKFLCRRITLLVHSSLEAVGLLAVVSAELAQHGISANCVSGYFHDHLFVPATQGDRALAVLQALQRRVSGSSTPRGASTSNLLENVVIREMTLGDYDAVRGYSLRFPASPCARPIRVREHNSILSVMRA